MPRIIVVDDNGKTTMDERVVADHLDDEHSAVQLLERLAWGIEDAEKRLGPPRRRRRRGAAVPRSPRPQPRKRYTDIGSG